MTLQIFEDWAVQFGNVIDSHKGIIVETEEIDPEGQILYGPLYHFQYEDAWNGLTIEKEVMTNESGNETIINNIFNTSLPKETGKKIKSEHKPHSCVDINRLLKNVIKKTDENVVIIEDQSGNGHKLAQDYPGDERVFVVDWETYSVDKIYQYGDIVQSGYDWYQETETLL